MYRIIQHIMPAVVLMTMAWSSCKQYPRNRSHEGVSESSIRRGERLAKLYCSSCHLLPDPSLLDSKSWERGVLPTMGPRLGIFRYQGFLYPSSVYDPAIGRSFYPAAPLVDEQDWGHIVDYFSATAPDTLPRQPVHEPIANDLSLFDALVPATGRRAPVTCYVHIDSLWGSRQLITGTIGPAAILRYDRRLQLIDSTPVDGSIVDMQGTGDSAILCNIGNINPNDRKLGSVSGAAIDGEGRLRLGIRPLFTGLRRPVEVVAARLNEDTLTDYLVCEFGNLRGALSWMENKGGGRYEPHILRAQPGAIKAYVQDINGDGKQDIWALFAQGDEGIWVFVNKGRGIFEERCVLRLPPVYGSTYFELADINGDGHMDILYTCGDNGDYSQVLKPYHGVYVYLNDGGDHFSTGFFYPINGCFKAMARDFDGDGDLDIAAISFFADYRDAPEEGFVYLENKGNMQFKPHSLPAAQRGRWLTMDAGDLDGDGRPDIVLGNFSVGPVQSRSSVDWKQGPPFLLLRNRGARR
ncbi:MAG: VCBS repeat-containing protein [Bacteroidetes bacterium]|nr:VCBS repeat-containing protein [Bacteroidota bacterium]